MPGHDDNIYFKQGKKYIPFGLRYDQNYLPDGIWYVRHFDHSYGHTNVDHYLSGMYKVGEIPDYIDIPKLCSIHSYTEYVMASPEFRKIVDSGSYSLMELTAKIVALVVKLNATLKDKEKDGTR
jgi:hypothetical protein